LCVGVRGIFDITTVVGCHCGWIWLKSVSNGYWFSVMTCWVLCVLRMECISVI